MRSTLTLRCLEDRSCPASSLYDAATQTLTVFGEHTDHVTVAPIDNHPPGFIRVTSDGMPVFDADTADQPVRRLVVRFDGVGLGELSLDADTRLPGGLKVFAAQTQQTVNLGGKIGGNFRYVGGPGSDLVRFTHFGFVGKDAIIDLGAGDDDFSFGPGPGPNVVGRDLTVTGGDGRDELQINWLTVGRNAVLDLGDGTDAYQYTRVGTAGRVEVLGSLSLYGGVGTDDVRISRTNVGGGLTMFTREGNDEVRINDTAIAGDTLIALGAGDDLLRLERLGQDAGGDLDSPTFFGGRFTARFGQGYDEMDMSSDGDDTSYVHFGRRVFLYGGNDSEVDTIHTAEENVFEAFLNLAVGFNGGTGPGIP